GWRGRPRRAEPPTPPGVRKSVSCLPPERGPGARVHPAGSSRAVLDPLTIICVLGGGPPAPGLWTRAPTDLSGIMIERLAFRSEVNSVNPLALALSEEANWAAPPADNGGGVGKIRWRTGTILSLPLNRNGGRETAPPRPSPVCRVVS